MTEDVKLIWDELDRTLPPIVPRKTVSQLTGQLFSRGYLANLDSKGLGPSSKVRIGRLICYEKHDFISWLQTRLKS